MKPDVYQILDPLNAVYQSSISERKSDPQTGQRS